MKPGVRWSSGSMQNGQGKLSFYWLTGVVFMPWLCQGCFSVCAFACAGCAEDVCPTRHVPKHLLSRNTVQVGVGIWRWDGGICWPTAVALWLEEQKQCLPGEFSTTWRWRWCQWRAVCQRQQDAVSLCMCGLTQQLYLAGGAGCNWCGAH